MTQIGRVALAGLLAVSSVAGCATPAASPAPTAAPTAPPTAPPTPVVPTDYSLPANWAAVPTTIDKPIDVFYVYPTVWAKTSPSDPDVNNIDNASMHAGVAQILPMQASAFAPIGNLYAPFYRQADGKTTLGMSFEQGQALVGGVPKDDVFAAFEYYLEHDNKGRPFVILSHSQGSNVVTFLLSEFMPAHPDVYARMIAAYVIGYGVTDEYLAANPHLRFAGGATDTGVIISYNTESPAFNGANPVMAAPGLAQVINPIAWTRAATTVPASASLGAYMPTANGLARMAAYADATLDSTNGVIRCSTVDPASMTTTSGTFPLGVFHAFDISLYYYDLQANAAARVAAYLATHK